MDSSDRLFDGTLGAVVGAPGGERAVMSGHVAADVGRRVFATTMTGASIYVGRVAEVIRSATVDIAWTHPAPISSGDLAGHARVIRDPQESDVGHSAKVLVAWDFNGRISRIDDVFASASFVRDGALVSIHGLFTLHPAITTAGDSGAPVIDDNGNLIGFVVGAKGDTTYVVPARRAINALEAN